MAKAKSSVSEKLQHFDLRMNFKALQLSNVNYFGNIKESKLKSVMAIAGNTFYEDIKCVSYNPDTTLLHAAIVVKQGSGYSGGPCTNGSIEYVRFYVDYARNGTWVDEGVVGTNVHDLGFTEDLCYNVYLKISPDKRSCCDDPAVLPRVRAILSWNSAPPANQPNWGPVWGRSMETNIQIRPSSSFWCLIKHGIKLDELVKTKLVENIDKLDLPVMAAEPKAVSLPYLKGVYKKDVEDTRIVLKHVMDLSQDTALASSPGGLNITGINWQEIVDKIKLLNFNTTYEEVKCVALNRDWSSVHASVVIKRSTGYLGGLCTHGSREYVAFYMDFGSGYQYMGTSSVNVHDIPTIPKDDLWYNVSLPVNLEKHQQEWCKTGKAKLKAILSWNVAPPPNQPNYVAAYGDWEECNVEIKPLPKGITPGNTVIALESVGSMPIPKINNATGLANGTNVGSTFTAVDSPFDYKVNVNGLIFFAGGASYKYRIMLKKPGDAMFYPVTNSAVVQTNTSGVISSDITLNPDGQGWMDYLGIPGTVTIVNNYLGYVYPAINGLHSVYVEIKNLFTLAVYNSVTVTFLADKDDPDANIEIDAGNCKTFTQGTLMTGTFSMTDAHALSLSLSLAPADEIGGEWPKITSPIVGGSSMSYGVSLPGGGTSGTWELDTSDMNPCGYVIRIDVYDRTIINSSYIGHHDADDEGFCLIE